VRHSGDARHGQLETITVTIPLHRDWWPTTENISILPSGVVIPEPEKSWLKWSIPSLHGYLTSRYLIITLQLLSCLSLLAPSLGFIVGGYRRICCRFKDVPLWARPRGCVVMMTNDIRITQTDVKSSNHYSYDNGTCSQSHVSWDNSSRNGLSSSGWRLSSAALRPRTPSPTSIHVRYVTRAHCCMLLPFNYATSPVLSSTKPSVGPGTVQPVAQPITSTFGCKIP
jgi:hypothetical protein